METPPRRAQRRGPPGAPYPGSSSPREILRDCFATFVLYLRFYTHLLLRTGVRFLLSCSHVASSLLLVLQWVVRDIVESVETNPPRAVALSCSVLAVLVAGLLALRIALKLVKMFIDDVVALTTDGKKRGNTVPAVVRTARRTRGGEAGNAGRNGGNGKDEWGGDGRFGRMETDSISGFSRGGDSVQKSKTFCSHFGRLAVSLHHEDTFCNPNARARRIYHRARTHSLH